MYSTVPRSDSQKGKTIYSTVVKTQEHSYSGHSDIHHFLTSLRLDEVHSKYIHTYHSLESFIIHAENYLHRPNLRNLVVQ